MNKLKEYRYFLNRMFGVLLLIASLGNSVSVARAAQTTNDISVTIVANQSKIKLGQNITYTITMTNLGPDDAIFVDVYHNLPDQLSLVSLTCDKGISPDTPACEYSTLASGETVVSTLVATLNQNAQNREKYLITTATIAFETVDTVDPNSSNNSASVAIKLIGR